MSDRIGRNLANILANSARKQTVTRTPRKPSAAPAPPVLSPAGNIGAAIGRAASGAAPGYTSPYTPPPPKLSFAEVLGQNVRERAAQPLVDASPKTVFTTRDRVEEVVRTPRERGDREWAYYDVDGALIAMPTRVGQYNNLNVAMPIPDPSVLDSEATIYGADQRYKDMVKMPPIPEVGSMAGQIASGFKQVKQQAESISPTEEAKKLTDFASKATGDAMTNAAEIMSPEWQAEHEFALVTHRENNTTHLIPRKELRHATDPETGQFNLITNAVSRDEAKSMVAAGAIDGDTRMVLDRGTTDSVRKEPGAEVSAQDRAVILRNIVTRQVAAEQDVVEIDGKFYPAGTTEPVNLDTIASDQERLGLDVLPEAPEGWAWAANGYSAWLVVDQRDKDGNLVGLPEGVNELEPYDTPWHYKYTDPASGAALGAMEKVATLLLKGTGIPVVGPYVEAVIKAVAMPQNENIDSITRLILYPDDTTRLNKASQPFRLLPPVQSYETWLSTGDNAEVARGLYENGYDTDDDGNPDLFGADAVTQYWHDTELTDAGGVTTWALFQLLTDPLTYVGAGSVGGKIISRGGRTLRLAPEAGVVRRGAGHVIEGTGTVISRTSTVAEDFADLGARHVLGAAGWLFKKGIGPLKPGELTSGAKKTGHLADAESVITEATRQDPASVGTGSIGTLSIDPDTGEIYMRVNDANAPTTGPAATAQRGKPVNIEEMDRLRAEAADINVGDSIPTDEGVATRTETGWEVTTDDGTVFESPTLGTIGQAVEAATESGTAAVPDRWKQRPLRPGRTIRYLEGMNADALYSPLAEELDAKWIESTAAQRANGEKIPAQPRHLNESDRIAWETITTAQSIDPTYSRPWEINSLLPSQADASPQYVLAEVFRRSSNDTALSYWNAMSGDGSVVPLLRDGTLYEGSAPLVSTKPVKKSIKSITNKDVVAANYTLDNIYSRLRWHPETITDPRFRTMIEEAIELDADLRSRGLRQSALDASGEWWSFPPILELIDPESPITVRPELRAATDPNPSPMNTANASPQDLLSTVALDKSGAVVLKSYVQPKSSVPDVWLNDGVTRRPDLADTDFWVGAAVEVMDGEQYRVYSPDLTDAQIMAEETAMARGLIPPGQDWLFTPQDHIKRVTGQDAIATPQEAAGATQSAADVEPAPVPSEPAPAPPVSPDASLAARLRQMLDEVEGVQEIQPEGMVDPETVSSTPVRTVAEVAEAEHAAAVQRMEMENRVQPMPDQPSMARLQPTGETMPDPSGTVEFPVRRAPDVPEAPVVESPPAVKAVLDDVMSLDDNSPRLRVLEAQAGKPTPATHAPRTGQSVTSQSDLYWAGRTIEEYQHEVLTAHPFPDGETLKDRITRYILEEGDKVQWRQGVDPQTYFLKAIDRAWPEYAKHLDENVFQTGVLSNKMKARIAKLPAPIRKPLELAAAALRGPLKAYDGLSRFYRERILFNWPKILHYPGVQYVGNIFLAGLSGDLRTMAYMSNPKNIARAYKAVKEGSPTKFYEATGVRTPNQKMHAKLGTTPAPETRDVLRGRGIGNEQDKLIGQATLEKLPGGKVWSKAMGSRFARDFGAAMDVVYRDAIEYSSTTRRIKEVMPDYRNAQINNLVDWLDVDVPTASRMWKEFEDTLDGWEFSYDDVKSHFAPVVGRGRAERMGRDWRATLNNVRKDVRGDIRHRAMAQGQTRADLVAQRAMAFHFFQVRQMWFMYNQMANHPFLINMYMTATEELERMSEDWPPYMQGWVRLMTAPGGRALFLNPFALLSTYTLFQQENTFRYDQDGEHRNKIEGWIFDWTGIDIDLQDIGLNPVLDKAINVTGLAGDTWSPDLLQIGRESQIYTLMVNTARATGLIGDDPTPVGDFNTDVNSKAREGTSTLLSKLFPGVFDPVESRSSEVSMDREIRAIMSDELSRTGIDPESEEGQRLLNEAELNTDSDLYRKSLKRWILGEWVEQGVRVVAGPLRPRTRIVNAEGKDLMTNLGENTKRFVNTPEPMVTAMRLQQSGYYEIGDRRTRGASDIWSDIAYGTPAAGVTVNGIRYTRDEIMAMDTEQRKAIANGRLAELGLLDDIHAMWDEQDKYLAQPENRDYAQYQTWKKAVRDYPGGMEQYWLDLIEGNPTAAAYYNTMIKDEEDPRVRERLMVSNNAYFNLMGWHSYAFDKPVASYDSRGDIYDPVNVANQAPAPIPYKESNAEFKNEVRQAPVFMSELQSYDAAAEQVMVSMGYPPGTKFNTLSKNQRIAVEDALEAQGINKPKPSWQVKEYLEWVEKQPAGVDVSIEAFLAANQEDYYKNLPGKTDAAVRKSKPVPSPDQYGNVPTSSAPPDMWSTIFDLLNEYDHNTYKDPWSRP